MAIAAYAIGASKAYVYIRAEYPLAIKRLKAAIAQAEANGLARATTSSAAGFDLHVIIKMGAGAFVCGEETALDHSIEGRAACRVPARRSRRSAACSASPRSSTTSRRWPTARPRA
jgi:NADH:ubiquinone oxidoreductase subunit F (NADH-binding)